MMNPTELISRKALFIVNHSGGKDSQAMLIKVLETVPVEQILVIHADLPGVDWKGTEEHVKKYLGTLAYRKITAVKTFMEMVDRRQNWPSPAQPQCTSDLKRGPIEKAIRHYIKDNDLSGLVVNCMGMRAQESHRRAKQQDFRFNARNSKAGREWYDWLPIFNMLETEVFASIKAAGQEPHWAYSAGMSRLSCCFCIMASKKDLRISAKHNPELFQKILQKEKEIGKTMFMEKKKPISLDNYIKQEAA